MSKRILFLTPQFPYPPQQGTAIRNYHLVAQTAHAHEVYLLSFRDTESASDPGPLAALCADIRTVPVPVRSMYQRLLALFRPGPDMAHRLASVAFGRELGALLRQQSMDVIQVEGLEMAPYGLAAQRVLGGDSPLVVFDAHNAEYVLQERIFSMDVLRPRRWPGAAYSFVQKSRLRTYEGVVCRSADHVVSCSPADALALQNLVPGLDPIVVPNGVDIEHYRPGVVPAADLGPQALVFTGKMDFRPNVDAMLWFCEHVMPRIRESVADVQLYIVGKNPHVRLQRVKNLPGVTVTGFVDDVRPYIAGAALYIVPLLTGGGTRLKILEAMAMGKPIVSTTLGAEGIDPGPAVLLADGASAFAAAVLRLLRERPMAEALGVAARSFVEQRFDWRSVTRPLMDLYGDQPR